MGRVTTFMAALLAMVRAASAQDNGQYSLLNPTPERQMREMTTDRPDMTESPFTIDAGHIQFESTLFGYSRSRRDQAGVVGDSYELSSVNMRVGLTNSAEFNVVGQPYGVIQTRCSACGGSRRDAGIGGIDLRAKFNIWGNDNFEKVGWALALLPYVSLPTDRRNGISPEYVDSGIVVPLAMQFTKEARLGLSFGSSWTRGGQDDRYHMEHLMTASFAYDWTDKFGTYYEVGARFNVPDPRGREIVMIGTGLTYAVTSNLQLDAGINFGVTPTSDRINPFIGFANRF
ncbi:transporter [Hyphomicrobium sp. CS1BSMeth3]|uniref:transporter n=1 Tax=Hyphomicrobium sp. CS1BSMeth3 TaxID=1892844 RepID=UPI000930C7C2|nr:transporter [Hyphomicrobium sp. CS1BSMeth3]